MMRLIHVMLLCYVCLAIFLFFDLGEAKLSRQLTEHPRQRRYLSFLNITHFFLKINFKANMVPWCQIFAQAIGFRINWDDPPDSFHPHHLLYRRTVYNSLELLLEKNGITGFQCIRRAICETQMLSEPRSVYFKILKIIFRQQSPATNKWHNSTLECEEAVNSCPFSVLDVSLYTDIT